MVEALVGLVAFNAVLSKFKTIKKPLRLAMRVRNGLDCPSADCT